MKYAPQLIICLVLLLTGINASAFCFKEAGERYNVDPVVLYAIAKQESGFNPKAYHKNTNGTYDISLMQINSSWFDELARFGITETALVKNPCLSVNVGAWVLAQNRRRYGNDNTGYWSAIGAYNAGNRKINHNKRMNYAWLIYKQMASLK